MTSTTASSPLHFWLRHEVKPGEERVMLVPSDCAKLLAAGHQVSVEQSPTRCIDDSEYVKAGCTMEKSETWASAPADCVILGLKELPESTDPLTHRHIFFAHCYKQQGGWKEILNRFVVGEGTLWDLEFLVDGHGRRVAAFGRPAGICGMAVGLLTWSAQHLGEQVKSLTSWKSTQKMIDEVKEKIVAAREKASLSDEFPSALVIGALGRCGGGATWFAEQCGVKTVVKWDMEETKGGGPFPELLTHDVLVNCIYLSAKIPAFISKEMLGTADAPAPRTLRCFVDVSCDSSNPNNPFPIYNTAGTTLTEPVERICEASATTPPLDVVGIDHLPTLAPVDSSEGFSGAIVDHVLQLQSDPTKVWDRALTLFHTRCEELKADDVETAAKRQNSS